MRVSITKPKRSLDQNALYHSLIGIIAKELGYQPDDLHEQIKVRFLGVEEKTVFNQKLIMPKSTTTLNKREFSELIDKVYALGMGYNIKLPTADHYGIEV